MALLPGQQIVNGVSNFIWGANNPDYNQSLQSGSTSAAIEAQLAANHVTVIRCPIEIGGTNCTDAQLDAMVAACSAVGAKMLAILRYSDLTFSTHAVTHLGSNCNLYEFSNEPDLTGVSVASYSSAWNANVPTWRGINPSAAFIGCALGDIGNNEGYLITWLQNCINASVLPDGISFHIYPCTSNSAIPQNTCLLDAPSIGTTAASVSNTVQSMLGNALPICITEWNIDAYYGNSNHQSYSTNTAANANFIESFTASAIDSMAANGVAMACQFELNYYLVDDVTPSTAEPQMTMMANKYAQYIGSPGGGANAANPYGYTVFDRRPLGDPNIPQVLADMQAQGATWLRYQLPWKQIDPNANGDYTPGGTGTNLVLSGLDSTVQACNAAGINIMFTVQYPPGDPSAGTGYYLQYVTGSELPANGSTPTWLPDSTMTGKFAKFLATRYNGVGGNSLLNALDIGNEDYDLFGNTDYVRDQGGTYLANTLVATYTGVKAASPNCFVLAGALLKQKSVHITNWITQLNTGNGIKNCDALSFHFYKGGGTYPVGIDPINPGGTAMSYPTFWGTMASALAATGHIKKKVWNTEYGYSVPNAGGSGNVDTAHQSLYLTEVFTNAMQSGVVDHIFWYTIGDNEQLSITQGEGKNETYQPAFTTMQQFIATNPQWTNTGSPSPYATTVRSDNPVAYYRLDEASGTTATDSSGNGFDGTYTGTGITYARTGAIAGASDTAVLFDGIAGEMTTPAGVAPAGWGAFTVEAWIRLTNTTFASAAPIWANDNPGTTNKGFNLNIGVGATKAVLNIGNGTLNAGLNASFTFAASTYYHVVGTWNGTTMTVYVNGAAINAQAFSGTVGTPTFATAIGYNQSNSHFFPGRLDEPAIYNTCLSPARVLAHYAAGVGGPPTLTVTPTALTPTTAGVTQIGSTYTATVTIGNAANSSGIANWSIASTLSGVTYSQSGGQLGVGASTAVTISGIPAMSGTFTISGAELETPVTVTWTYTSPPSAQAYTVNINGNPVFVVAGSLQITNTIGKRSTASFIVKTADGVTHFAQYQQVSIYDQSSNLVFSGYITSPQEQPPRGVWPGQTQPGSLLHTITCCDQHFLADKRIIAASYTNKTCGYIVQDIVSNILSTEGVTIGQVFDGPTPSDTLYPSSTLFPGGNVGLVPSATFVYCTVSAALDALVKEASSSGVPYYWQIDQNKQLWFVPYTAVVNTTVVDGTQIDMVNNPPTVTNANPTYRNTEYITGGVAQTLTQTETRVGDGNTTAWSMGYDLAQAPTVNVSLNGGAFGGQSVGVKGVSTGLQWYWQQGSPDITQDSSQAKLRGAPYNDRLQVIYVGQYPTVILAEDSGQVAYQQSVDNTSGIIEVVDQDATLTSVSDGLTEASSFLTRYAVQGQQLVFSTLQEGFQQGQLITVNLPVFNINTAQMLIESVAASDQTDGMNIWYTIQAVLGPYDVTWADFWSKSLATPAIANSINVGVGQSVTLLVELAATITVSATATITTGTSLFPSHTLFPSSTLFPD